ncbi:hypothetical protein IQ06DRAFT_359258 [Phaeosphaeriaceae sp. SRC1lsM3a]|nr:hypothetical protein IQ06DRAFT_359258 [Stagonospora sp. SRC1lsM3a]
MARLAHTPTFLAARANKSGKPAVSRRAPIQSVAATTKASLARPSPTISASSRTTLRAGSKALQHTQSARKASAVASRTSSREKHDSKQLTRIPGPVDSKTIAKLGKTRKYHTIKYEVYVKEKTKTQEYEDDEDCSIVSDTNLDLLLDKSFDETHDRYEQSCPQTILKRFEALHKVLKNPIDVIGRHPGVHIPCYSGAEQIKLGRRRPRAVPAPNFARGIPQELETTLKYRRLGHAPAPSANMLEQIKAEKLFGFGFKLRVEFKNQQDLATQTASIPLLHHRDAYTKDVKTLFELGDGWTPIKLNATYPGNPQATGFDTMFMQTSRQTITLRRRVAIRFKAVQEYEKRRHQDSIEAGETPVFGQLEYGNTDYKIALHASDVVTADNIGTLVEPGKFNLPPSICSGPLLHFGGFAKDMGESFEDTLIPAATAAAYKMPVHWRKAPEGQDALDKWVALAFPALQQAKLEE